MSPGVDFFFSGFIFLIFFVFVILFVRWLVWRHRLKKIRSSIATLREEVSKIHDSIALLQDAVRSGQAVGKPAALPAELREKALTAAAPRKVAPEAPAVPARATPPAVEMPAAKEPAPAYGISPPQAEPPASPAGVLVRAPSALRTRLREAIKTASGAREWELLIGGRLLNKIGVGVLVIGMALLLNFSLQYMGPLGKTGLGAGVSAVLLLGGVWLEWRRGYAIIARSLVGGGWALLYFTAYAAHNIDAARIIDDPMAGLALLSVVAAGMILHSLRYNSETTTGIAYFLAFLAIDINPLAVYSLAAVAILAGSLVFILRRRDWRALGLFGVVATYLTHFIWSILTPPPAGSTPVQAFWLSQGMLVLYWLLFASCDLRPMAADKRGRLLILALNTANTLGFAVLSAIQTAAVFPDRLYMLAGAGAVAYMGKSALDRPWSWRRLHLIDGSIAIAVMAIASVLALRPLWIPAEWLAIAFLVEGVLVLAVGFWLEEFIFRTASYLLLGGALCFALAFNVFALHAFIDLGGFSASNGQQVFDIMHVLYVAPVGQRVLRWSTVLPIFGVLFFLEYLQRPLGRERIKKGDRAAAVGAGYGATGLLAALLWQEVPSAYVGLAWLASAVTLVEFGLWGRNLHRRIQGYLLYAMAACALLLINVYGVTGPAEGETLSRWLAITPAVAAGWLIFWHLVSLKTPGDIAEWESRRLAWPAHVATGLLAVLVWKQLDPPAIALAWGAMALVTYELGSRLRLRPIELQSHVLTVLAYLRLFLANFPTTGIAFGLSIRMLTVLPVVALLYYQAFPSRAESADDKYSQLEAPAASLYLYAAAFALTVLARFEFDRSHAVIAWAGLSIVYLALGVKLANRDFRWQSYLIAIAAFIRCWGTNFYLTGSFYGLPERVATAAPVIICLFATGLLWRAQRAALVLPPSGDGILRYLAILEARSKTVMLSLAALLLASLLFYTVTGNLLTIAWAAEGLLLLTAGFGLSERILRLSGLALLTVCLLKVFIVDLSGVETIYRIMSFIVLGLILLAVSFAYTRYRDIVMRYL